MKRLVFAASLVLACFGARAQGVMPSDTLPPRPSVDLLNYGVSTVRVKHNPADGKNVRVVATGEATPLPAGYTRHKTVGGHSYITGPKGGCFYLDGNGKKVYVDHKYCR